MAWHSRASWPVPWLKFMQKQTSLASSHPMHTTERDNFDIKVAILLATFNGKPWLTEQLSSIFSQRSVKLTVFIGDDGSEDGTLDSVIAMKNQPITLLSNKTRFGSAGQNFFRLLRDVDFLSYDYVSLSDQDDIWNHDKLIQAIQLIQRRKTDAASANVLAFWPNGKTKLLDKSQPQTKWDYLFEAAGPGCTYVFSQKIALALQEFLRSNQHQTANVVLHDWLIYAWTRHNGYRWSIDPHPSMKYRQHDHNQVGANTGWKPAKTRFLKIREGWYRDQALRIANLIGADQERPIQLLTRFRFVDKLMLTLLVTKLRRRWRDRFAFIAGLFLTKQCKSDL
jgi:rhamnosyltransferase